MKTQDGSMSTRKKLYIEMIWYAFVFIAGASLVSGWLEGTREWWWGLIGLIALLSGAGSFAERWKRL